MLTKKIHFLHIGKTGGSAITHALKDEFESKRCEIIFHNHEYALVDVPIGEKCFFSVRDPIERFVSGFYSRQRKGQPRYYSEWSKEESEIFQIFKTPDELACALSSEDKQIKRTAIKAMKSIYHVKDSYWKWFVNERYFISRINDIHFILFQERLSEDFDFLMDTIEKKSKISLPKCNVAAHRNPDNLDRRLSGQSMENLKEWYREDFEFIKLCEHVRIHKMINFHENRGIIKSVFNTSFQK